MDTFALIPVRRSIASQISLSPLGAMIATLEARTSQTGHTHFGRVTWSALPVRHLLADAAALIIDAVAARHEQRLGTQTDAEKVAEATDARLNMGILLLYTTPESAADAFEVQVCGALTRAIKVGYRPGMALTDEAWRALMRGAAGLAVVEIRSQTSVAYQGDPSTFWVRPAYFFLAACVRRGREFAETLRNRVTRLSHENTHRVPGMWVLSDLSSALQTIEWLEGDTSVEERCEEALQLYAKLDEYEALLAVGIAVMKSEHPLRGHELCVKENGMFIPWLNTAILKVARADTKITSGPLSPEQAVEALEGLRTLDVNTIVEHVVSMVAARAQRVSPVLLVQGIECVRAHVLDHGSLLKRSHHAPALNEHFIDPYLFGETQSIVLTHEAAMEYLDPFSMDDVRESLPDELMQAIESALRWQSFDAEEFQMLIEGGTLPHDVILRHLGDLRDTVRKKAVETLLEFHPELVNELLVAGHVRWGAVIIERCEAFLAPVFLLRTLRESLLKEESFEHSLPKYVGLMLLLPAEMLSKVWQDPAYHDPLVAFMEAFLFDSEALEISTAHERVLQQRVRAAFRSYALEAYVAFRAGIYNEEPLLPANERRMPTWEQTSSNRRTSWSLVVRMRRVFGKHLQRMIAEHPEEVCYRSLVQNKPDRDLRVMQFFANRSRFYGP